MSSRFTQLSDLVVEVDERNPPDRAEVFSVSERHGIIPQRELFTKQIATADRSKYRCIQQGDVVFNPYLLWNCAVGVCFHQGGGCVSPAYPVLRPRCSGTERFLHYFFRSKQLTSAVNAIATGSVTRRRTAPLEEILSLIFQLPSIESQKEANRLLQVIDDKIELNRRINTSLESMVRALFQSWFVDFDPVRAKLDGRKPSGLDAATDALFSSHFHESPLGHIPQGWTTGSIGNIATNLRRGVQPNDIVANTPYIALEHMPRRCIALGDWDDSADVASGKSVFHKGEILFGKLRPYFHKVGVAPIDGVCSTDILVLTPKSPEWFGFLLGHASSDALIQFTDLASTGTKMPRTNWGDISSFKVALPPKPIAAAFTRIIEPMTERIFANLHQSRTLSTLRDSLLPKLLSGDIRVPTAEEERASV